MCVCNIIRAIKYRRLKWAGHLARIKEGRSALKITSKPRRRWEDNVRMCLKVISINTRNWVNSAQDRNYWRVLVNLRVP